MKRINAANGLKSVCRSNSYDSIIREYDAFGLEEQWALICGQRSSCYALPFEGYNTDWDDWHRKRMDFICRYAEKVLVLGEMPSSESYKKRNYYMVEQAGHMIAVYDNAHNMRSGTQQTVNYAKKKGLQIIYIHPDTAQVTEEDITKK